MEVESLGLYIALILFRGCCWLVGVSAGFSSFSSTLFSAVVGFSSFVLVVLFGFCFAAS
jgi:hypothetical protein